MTSPVLMNGCIAALSFGAVTVASLLQSSWGLQPCTMCIIQRYAFLLIGLVSLVRAVASVKVENVLRWVASLVALGGILASARIQWAISMPSVSCGRDKLASFLNNLPWVELSPGLFEATGSCGDKIPPVFGLPFHVWSMMLFIMFLLMTWHHWLPVFGAKNMRR